MLSHWPQSPTPDALARDLSAGIVFAFLHVLSGRAPWLARGDKRRARAAIIAAGELAEAVTNDHFDEDGLVSVFAAADPEMALRNEELLVEVASCGDFGVVRSRQAARIAFSIGPMGEEAVVAEDLGAERPGSFLGPRYRAVLERFAELVEHTDRFSRYWQDEDDALAEGLGDLESGRVVVEELPEVDLAVARRVKGRPLHPRGAGAGDPVAVNEVALHSATTASRVLVFDEGRCELRLRYEGWVRYVSRRVPLRPDLAPLAAELSALEPTGRAWAAGGVGSLVTRHATRARGDGTRPRGHKECRRRLPEDCARSMGPIPPRRCARPPRGAPTAEQNRPGGVLGLAIVRLVGHTGQTNSWRVPTL